MALNEAGVLGIGEDSAMTEETKKVRPVVETPPASSGQRVSISELPIRYIQKDFNPEAAQPILKGLLRKDIRDETERKGT